MTRSLVCTAAASWSPRMLVAQNPRQYPGFQLTGVQEYTAVLRVARRPEPAGDAVIQAGWGTGDGPVVRHRTAAPFEAGE
ncbi:hypothetical protein [Streptomyces avermitilis]|uniref:hypothetical protein n=1 Tax=Streptomyces avermitilis TaxID=33903 RepID=UPI00382142BE